MQPVRTRGLLPDDDQTFSPKMREKLAAAQQDLHFLLNRGYPLKSAATFAGNHYQLSSRQLLALTRATASAESLRLRRERQLEARDMAGRTMYLDGLNIIISMEVALSGGMLFVGMDGVIRDLAELRGTYRIIPQTGAAVAMLRETFERLNVSDVVIFLDAPVSNSGRLKTAIYEEEWPFPLEVTLTPNPDADLKALSHVASGDSIILEACTSWFNLVDCVLKRGGPANPERLVRLNGTAADSMPD